MYSIQYLLWSVFRISHWLLYWNP